MTQVIRLDSDHPQPETIAQAASLIRLGCLVAFPTETVYGLGADAMNEGAIQRLFEAKGRPADNPLIVHIWHREMLDVVAADISARVETLIDRFWPGPLTLVLKRHPKVPATVSAGLLTVAVRMPANTIAIELIRSADSPIAAPSANISGRPSPTTAAHVLEDLDGRIDLILDGGPTSVGIESTVLDVTSDEPLILRPGAITREMLGEVIGGVAQAKSAETLGRSPGTRHRHYSPSARVILVEHESTVRLEQLCRQYVSRGAVGFIGHTPIAIDDANFKAIIVEATAEAYAHSIYSALRELDQPDAIVIIVEGISEEGAGAAVMDRLRRAATEVH